MSSGFVLLSVFFLYIFASCRRPPPGMSHWGICYPSVAGGLSLAILVRTVAETADAVSEVTSAASATVIAGHVRFLHHCYTVGTTAYLRGARSHIAQGISPFRAHPESTQSIDYTTRESRS